MDKQDFFDRFVRSLENTKERHDLDTVHDALIVWFGENCLSLDPDEVKERIVKDSCAEGVDAILIDKKSYKLFFIQAKTVDNFDNTNSNFPENDVKSTLSGVRLLLRSVYKGKITPELENLVDEYHELVNTCDYKTAILFLTLKKKPVDHKFVESFKEELLSTIEIDFYDFDWLFDFYVNKYLIVRAAPPERISFKVLSDLLAKGVPIKSRVFTCKGEELARIYSDHRESIFQQNVRYSLGLRSKSINRQISETATHSERGKNFWYFNNGITIVCKKINEVPSGKVINLEDAQIINGAQTTYALYDAYKDGKLRDDVEVLIKAIEASDRDFIESVTLYTNSQNAIRLRDLCSNDEIQLKIQNILYDSYRYFYERKRGGLDSSHPTEEGKRELLGDDHKFRVINNENAAQAFLATYLDKPAQAKSEKGRIFMKDEAGFYDGIFNEKDDILAEKILMSWKLLKYIERLKKSYHRKYNEAEDLPENERNEIYKYDFLLHSEYFILNIFKDFLKNAEFDINSKRGHLLEINNKIDKNDELIRKSYETIKDALAECVNDLRARPGYYHNKFFKNEKSIGLVRKSLSGKYPFIEVI